jgi:PmbA protein
LLGVYESSTNVASLYNHTSNFKIGESIQSDIKGDAINLRMVDVLEGSIHNAPVDADGVVLVSCDVIKDGIFTQAWGDARHSCYMNVPVTGNLRNAHFQGGQTALADLEKGDALEVLDFSSFIVDDNTGDFSGEIRLGYQLKDGNRTPVSGGSISGNLLQLHHELYLSKETQRFNRYEGPIKLRLKNVSVAGIK